MSNERTIQTIEYKDFSLKVHDQAALHGQVIKAQLELTYRCNLHCRHCYTDPYNSKEFFPRELTTAEIYRLLDEMRNLGIIWLNLTGGDIFMHPDFFEIYERAHSLGFLMQLYTNGTLFTKAVIERLQTHLPFTIDISCHSIDEARFDWFTQVPGSYRAFMRGIDLLKRSGMPYDLKASAMNWNEDDLTAIQQFAERNARPLHISPYLAPRLNGDTSSLAFRQEPDAIVAREFPQPPSSTDPPCAISPTETATPTNRLFRCGCGTDTIHISAWGELGTCTQQYLDRRSLRTMSLNDAISTVFQSAHARRYHTDSPCRTCTIHTLCDKKPTEAQWECGSAESPIPYHCDVALARAERANGRPLIHPLAQAHRMGLIDIDKGPRDHLSMSTI